MLKFVHAMNPGKNYAMKLLVNGHRTFIRAAYSSSSAKPSQDVGETLRVEATTATITPAMETPAQILEKINMTSVGKDETDKKTESSKPQATDVFITYDKNVTQTITPDLVRTHLSFDEMPGPAFLRAFSKIWSYIPIIGNQVTASTIQYMLSAGKLFGSQLSWGNNLWLYRYLLDEYGPVVRLHGPFGGDVVILSRPEHVTAVFENEGSHPVRSSLDSVEKYRLQYRKFKNAGPFIMYGAEWEKLRKMIEEPVKKSAEDHFDQMESISEEFIKRIMQVRNRQEEVPPNFLTEIYKWSMETLLSITLNKRLGFLDPRGLSSTSEPAMLLEDVVGATNAIRRCESGLHMWKFFETSAWKSLVKHCDSIDTILSRHMRKAQDILRLRQQNDAAAAGKKVSLMENLLIQKGLLPEDVLTVLLDMLLLGVNMTAHSAAFMFYHLARNPRAQHKLYEEICAVPDKISKEQLMSLPYLQACVKENLRLKPPMPVLSRILTKDIVVHGYKIPKGTYMLLATFLSSLREEHFEDAMKFMPQRWLNDGVNKELESLATIPYGHGPKACLAKDLAQTQLNMLTFKVLRKFRIDYHYGDIKSNNKLLAAPDRPLKFRFVERL